MFNFFQPKVEEVDVDVVKKAMDGHQTMILLDVRTPGEFASGKLEGAINVPLDMVSSTIEKELPDKNETIYVYCLSGSRSVHAVDAMAKLGYKNVYNVTSGLLAWRVKGHPVAK
jgi:rhodanese-related sulfurtransferase